MPKGLDKKMGNYERTDCKHIADARVFRSVRHRPGNTIKSGADFITRAAPAAKGETGGGGIEVVIDKGGTLNNKVTAIKH
jgi:hypothetical protein